MHTHTTPTTTTKQDAEGLRGLVMLYAVALFLHFPLDIALTLSAWSFETNPIVIALGPERWVFVKVLVFVAASAVVVDAARYNPESYVLTAKRWLLLVIVLGLVFVVPNVLILSGVSVW